MWLLTKAGSVDGFVAMKKLHFFSETFRWHYTEPQSRSARKEKKHHSKSSSSRERTNSIRVNVTNRIDRSGRSISAPPLFARAIDRDVIGDVTKDRIVVLMRRSPDVQVSKVPTHTHTHTVDVGVDAITTRAATNESFCSSPLNRPPFHGRSGLFVCLFVGLSFLVGFCFLFLFARRWPPPPSTAAASGQRRRRRRRRAASASAAARDAVDAGDVPVCDSRDDTNQI